MTWAESMTHPMAHIIESEYGANNEGGDFIQKPKNMQFAGIYMVKS